MLSLVQVVLACVATWLLWTLFRRLTLKSDLDNLPGPPSPSFLYGNLRQLYSNQSFKFHKSLGEKYGPVVGLHGTLGSNVLYTFDPKAMHHIVIKDQDIFQESTWFTRMVYHLFGLGLFATLGDHHRKQRKMLNPVFSANHMRHMTPLFYDVSHKLRTAIAARVNKAGEGSSEVDMVGWMGRTALELMGQAGLGYSFDPLVADAADEYGEAIKKLVPSLAQVRGLHQYIPLFEAIVPAGLRRTVAELIPAPPLKRIMHIVDTLGTRSTEIFQAKKKALLAGDEALKEQVGEGKDLISVLLKANMAASEEDKLPEDELIGQMSTLTFAAMDTTSNALSLTLWRLAQNPEAQNTLRKEILEAQEARGGGDIGYDDLVALPYLDAVCRETLRVHTPSPFRFRETHRDVVLPLSEPVRGKDGRMMHELHIPKNTSVFIGINASNTNQALWGPDAYEWKPERWLAPLPDAVLDAKIPGVYANLMTFWGGGRACIGFKFSQLEMKVVLAVLLSHFTFELTEKRIWWNMATVQYPSADPRGEHPELPLKVGLVRKEVVQA
ncbi:cytochrome P450 [Trametes versicolor FP-101664 SS1]|uniref:cytochrome P450 n=1 Tax=Trametes versicolor (strain FP-101664) TaxID=717944 RepID=UPI000462310B|nr:cytochrome P450 [Trametes versicolor FP-101664 SS1]EIW54967.1 cytochrome P450 [Trametes versicolor FP-101664 SS1]